MDGDRDRDIHWNTGLNFLGPKKKQKEGEGEQGSQDQREPLSDDGEIETETHIGAMDLTP